MAFGSDVGDHRCEVSGEDVGVGTNGRLQCHAAFAYSSERGGAVGGATNGSQTVE